MPIERPRGRKARTKRGSKAVPLISATEPDWSREHKTFFEWAPSRSLLAAIRSFQRWQGRWGPAGLAMRKWAIARHRFWSIVTGCDIPVTARIGGGLLLPHPNGVVIHPEAVIGPNCLLFQQVTVGAIGSGIPTLGGHVDVGAGAKILGSVTVGDHAMIGANAVVLDDIPACAVAVGIPARIHNQTPAEQEGIAA